jgi:hypothetical protein
MYYGLLQAAFCFSGIMQYSERDGRMGVIQPIITAGPPSEYSHHCLMKDTR